MLEIHCKYKISFYNSFFSQLFKTFNYPIKKYNNTFKVFVDPHTIVFTKNSLRLKEKKPIELSRIMFFFFYFQFLMLFYSNWIRATTHIITYNLQYKAKQKLETFYKTFLFIVETLGELLSTSFIIIPPPSV